MAAAEAARPIRLGSRGSALALWQAEFTRDRLAERLPGVPVEIVTIRTGGDRDQSTKLHEFGGQGVFVKELEAALLEGRVDIAVHSLKDLPTQQPDGLAHAACGPRADWRDALVTRDHRPLAELRQGATVGTGSLRRQAQLRSLRPDLKVVSVRGNVQTRLDKLEAGDFDALLLACAGLDRLGLSDRIAERLGTPTHAFLPAPAQGIIGLETRADDEHSLAAARAFDDQDAALAAAAERSFMATLEAGCHAPVAALATIDDGADGSALALMGFAGSLDGQQVFRGEQRVALPASSRGSDAARQAAVTLGRELAERLLADGAARVLSQSGA